MLSLLRVRDLGVVEELSLELGPGMTALTGETGAGKTLLVEALQLVLGGRAGSGLVRAGAATAMVEAVFVRPDAQGDPELILGRSLPVEGRSRGYVDGRLCPVAALAEAGAGLVDIHGQREHYSLLSPSAQRDALDRFGNVATGPWLAARDGLADLERRLEGLGGDAGARARDRDVLAHQAAEIEAAGLEGPDEDRILAGEEERLADVAAHREAAATALAALEGAGDEGGGADGALRQALAALENRAPFAGPAGRLGGLAAEVADVASELRAAAEEWEDDPARLSVIQDRRRLLADLRRKYGPDLSDVVRFAQEARSRLAVMEAAESEAGALAAERDEAAAALAQEATELRRARAVAAPRLAGAVAEGLADLALPGARFEVSVGQDGAGEPVVFGLGTNAGEPVRPLAQVASGGELSRAMLALRLVAPEGPDTMVFDEVDAGVGGTAAVALGRALRAVARDRQVLVVTHLAQVAAVAHHQVAVRKDVVEGRTTVQVVPLDQETRVVELSRMLSGRPDSPTARAHAEELLAGGPGGR